MKLIFTTFLLTIMLTNVLLAKQGESPDESSDEEKPTNATAAKKQLVPLHFQTLSCLGQKLDIDPTFDSFRKVCYRNAAKSKQSAKTPEEKAALRVGKACIGICLWDMIGWLGDDLKLNQKAINDWIDEIFSSPKLKAVNSGLKKSHKKCSTIKGYKEGEASTEKSCNEFKPYLECVEDSFRELCKPEIQSKKGKTTTTTVIEEEETEQQQQRGGGGGGLLNLNLG